MARVIPARLAGGGLRGRRWLVALSIVAAILLILAVLQFTGALAALESSIPGLAPAAPTYQTTAVTRGAVSVNVVATGPVTAVSQLPLTFKSSGKLADVKVKVGDQVKQGQELATLDTTDLKVSLDQAKASLAQAQANLDKVQAGTTDTAKAVAQTSVDNAKSSAADAKANIATVQSSTAKDIVAAQASANSSATALATAQSALAAAVDQQAKSLASDQVAIANAQRSLDSATAVIAANGPIRLQAVEKSKDDLYAAQISRDAACGRGNTPTCQAANASIAGSETALSTAQAQIPLAQKQDAQTLAQAKSTLDSAQVALASDQSKLAASVTSAQNAVKQAQASLQSAQIGVAQSQIKAGASVQSAQTSANQAAGSTNAAQASYQQTVATPLPADINSAKAQVANAQASLDQAQANFDAATLTSPIDATVAAINGTIGALISGGASNSAGTATTAYTTGGLITLLSLNNLEVIAQVNEADIGKIKVDNLVNFTVAAFPNKQFSGKVFSIQPTGTVTSNVVNYNVISTIQSAPDAALYPGMTATATITADQRTGALLVPNTAISFAQSALRGGLVAGRTGGNGTGGANGRTGGGGAATANGTGGTGNTGATGGNRQGSGAAAGGAGGGANASGAGNGNAPASDGTGTANGAASGTRGIVLTLTNGQLTVVPVSLGITDGTSTEVLSGASESEPIVVGQSGAVGTGSGQSSGSNAQRTPAPATTNPLGGGGGGPRGGG